MGKYSNGGLGSVAVILAQTKQLAAFGQKEPLN